MTDRDTRAVTRRTALGLSAAAGLGALAGCGSGDRPDPALAGSAVAAPGGASSGPAGPAEPAGPAGPVVAGHPHRPAAAPGGPAVELASGPRTRPEVALTFHGAGDPALARQVLAVAEAAGARLTVLAVGTWLAAHPDLGRRIVGAGHELGNHTWTHPALARLPPAEVAAQIERCRDLVDRLTGSPGAHFRQSQGQHSTPLIRRLAGRAGYRVCLSYDVDSLDWTDPGPAAVQATVAARVRPGSVVSMHLGHPGTLAALPGVLADLRRRGLRPVTASTLLG